MTAIITAVLPYAIQYGVPAIIFLAGHISGWFHKKHSDKVAAAKAALPTDLPAAQ